MTDIEKIDQLINAGYHVKDVAKIIGCNESSVRVRACNRGSLRRRVAMRITLSNPAYERLKENADARKVSVETWLQLKLEGESK